MEPASFAPVFPVPVIVAIVGIPAIVAVVRAARGREMQRAWLKVPALFLRLVALALLALLLLNPTRPVRRPAPSLRSVLLVDKSASMGLGAPGKPSRWDEAAKWSDEAVRAVKAAGLPAPVVIPFDTDAQAPAVKLEELKPDGHGTRLASALAQVLSSSSEAPPAHVFVVSDGGARDRPDISSSLSLARSQGVPVSTRVVGGDTPPRNAWISTVQAPRIVRPRSRIPLRATVAVTGFRPGETLGLRVKNEVGDVVTSGEIRVPGAAGGKTLEIERSLPFDAGLRTSKYTLELDTAGGEVATDDNAFDFTVETGSTKLRVLYAEGTHSKRSLGQAGHALNDMEFIVVPLRAAGDIEVECLTPTSEYLNRPNLVGVSFANGEMIPDRSRSFPATREELDKFDVIIVSDVPVGNFSEKQMQWVVDWVNERGGGFLMAGGFTSFDSGRYDKTPWEKITPVDMVEYGDGYDGSTFEVGIPRSVRAHPIWRISQDAAENEKILASVPPFHGTNRIRRAKPGAIVLANRPDENNEPIIAAQSYGRGRSIAFLSDPNGGWGGEWMKWGPGGGAEIGWQNELGHGPNFHVDEPSTRAGVGPPPPFPSTWYGQFWVNVVNWLAENSVRWRRDKLSGSVASTQTEAGVDLAVSAEVPAVTNPDELLALDVGARLGIPGSPRVRLEYDRDRREFTGRVAVPANFSNKDVPVIFDATIHGESVTDTVHVGLRRVNPELVDTAPDAAFLADIARISGGTALHDPQDVAAILRKAAAERARQRMESWREPLWWKWPFWLAIMAVLGAEWALRRFGRLQPAPVSVAAALFLACIPWRAAAEPPSQKEIQAAIDGLGARLVRERDEAEDKLKGCFPEAAQAVENAAANSPSEEARLRAANILRAMQQKRWELEKTLVGHQLPPPRDELGAVAVAPDQRHFFTRAQDFTRRWNAQTLAPEITFGEPCRTLESWEVYGPTNTLAVSPDSQLVAATDEVGRLYIYQAENGKRVARIASEEPSPLWEAVFLPDGNRVATVDRNGRLAMWDIRERKQMFSKPTRDGDNVACALGISPDGKYLVISLDLPGEPDSLWVWGVEEGMWMARERLSFKISTVAFNKAGTQFIGASRKGTVFLWDIAPGGRLKGPREIGSLQSEAYGAVFSPDEKSILVTSEEAKGQLTEWDVATGKLLWRSAPLDTQLRLVAPLGKDRIVTTAADGKVRVWKMKSNVRAE